MLAVHEAGYVARVMDCALSDSEARAIGFPMHPSSVVRSLASTGGTVAATHDVMRQASGVQSTWHARCLSLGLSREL